MDTELINHCEVLVGVVVVVVDWWGWWLSMLISQLGLLNRLLKPPMRRQPWTVENSRAELQRLQLQLDLGIRVYAGCQVVVTWRQWALQRHRFALVATRQ